MFNKKAILKVTEIEVYKGNVANFERKAMKNTDKILDYIKTKGELVTLKELQDALELKPGILSGTLVSLLKSGKLTREKVEKTSGQGPKLQWAYKIIAQTTDSNVESSVD